MKEPRLSINSSTIEPIVNTKLPIPTSLINKPVEPESVPIAKNDSPKASKSQDSLTLPDPILEQPEMGKEINSEQKSSSSSLVKNKNSSPSNMTQKTSNSLFNFEIIKVNLSLTMKLDMPSVVHCMKL